MNDVTHLSWPHTRRAFLATSTMGLDAMMVASFLCGGFIAYIPGSANVNGPQ